MASISVVWPICSPGARDSTGSPSSSTENTPITSPSTRADAAASPSAKRRTSSNWWTPPLSPSASATAENGDASHASSATTPVGTGSNSMAPSKFANMNMKMVAMRTGKAKDQMNRLFSRTSARNVLANRRAHSPLLIPQLFTGDLEEHIGSRWAARHRRGPRRTPRPQARPARRPRCGRPARTARPAPARCRSRAAHGVARPGARARHHQAPPPPR